MHSARFVDGVTDARNYVRVARPRFSIVNELFGIYLAYCFMKNYMRGYKMAFLPSFKLHGERNEVANLLGLFSNFEYVITAYFARMGRCFNIVQYWITIPKRLRSGQSVGRLGSADFIALTDQIPENDTFILKYFFFWYICNLAGQSL